MKNLSSISLLGILLVPIFIFPILILYFGKEFYPLTKVIASQKKDPEVVFGTAYNGETSVPYEKKA